MTQHIDSIHDIIDDYDTFLLDQWGVLHNGGDILPSAMRSLHALHAKGKKVMIVSNNGRPRTHTYTRMADAGVARHLYCEVMTSGDHLQHAYAMGRFDKFGETPYFMDYTPVFDEIGGRRLIHTPIEQATYIFCCRAYPSVESRMQDLHIALDRGLELVCSNPDLYSKSPNGDLHPCPGLVAQTYENIGGQVHMFGKPYPEMYTLCHKLAGGWDKAIAVGDSLAHDIKGANTAHIDSIFITSGIHMDAIKRPADIAKLAQKYNAHPTYSLDWF